MADTTITDLPSASTIDGSADYLAIDTASPNATNRINRNTLLGVTGQPADISTAQSLTNKTIGNTNILTVRDDRFTVQDNGDTTKQVVLDVSGVTTGTTRTLTVPDRNSTIATLGGNQTFTGANSFTGSAWSGGTISNATITVDSIAGFSAATVVTVAGLQISAGVLNTNNSVVTANIADGAVTPAKLQSGTGSGWSWQTWSPTWTNVTVGNGTVIARYIQMGKTVRARLSLTFGTTSAISGAVSFTLPVTAINNYIQNSQIGTGTLEDLGTNIYDPWITYNSTTTASVLVKNSSTTYTTFTALSSTVPFAWATGDIMHLNFEYEAA